MSSVFRKSMTYPEAQRAFFAAVTGKSPAEKERLKKEYQVILKDITDREMATGQRVMTSHPLK